MNQELKMQWIKFVITILGKENLTRSLYNSISQKRRSRLKWSTELKNKRLVEQEGFPGLRDVLTKKDHFKDNYLSSVFVQESIFLHPKNRKDIAKIVVVYYFVVIVTQRLG